MSLNRRRNREDSMVISYGCNYCKNLPMYEKESDTVVRKQNPDCMLLPEFTELSPGSKITRFHRYDDGKVDSLTYTISEHHLDSQQTMLELNGYRYLTHWEDMGLIPYLTGMWNQLNWVTPEEPE